MQEILSLTGWSDIQLFAALFVIFLAAWVRGFSGFGFSALVMSGLAFVMVPSQIVALTLTLEVLASLHMAREVLKSMDFKLIGGLCIGAVIGTPVGVWLLNYLPAPEMKIVLYSVILGLAVLLLLSGKIHLENTKKRLVGVGFISGILNGMAAIGGLPIVLYLVITQFPAAATRAILVGYLFLTDGGALLTIAASGVVGVELFWQCLICLPVLVFGVWLGSRRFQKAVPENFKKFVLLLLMTISVIGLSKTLL